FKGLFSLQHRGQESAGMVISDGEKINSVKGHGLVNDVFNRKNISNLTGHLGIGHVRYSTTGSSRIQNIQPLVAECADGIWAVAHNGNLVNAAELRAKYQYEGAIFQTSTDSEILVHLLSDPEFRIKANRIERALSVLKGAFCFLLMNKSQIFAARDPNGFRPLSIGKIDNSWIISSETCAINQLGADFVRDVLPGELIKIDENGLSSTFFSTNKNSKLSQCIFEIVYFARPDSVVFGKNVHEIRVQYGMRLAKEHPANADIVIPVPDSGNSAALGFAKQSGIPLDFGFIRNHYIGRTFIMPSQGERSKGIDLKLAILKEVVKGKRIIIVDDSIVRGNTVKKRVAMLRSAGAKEVHVRISCPPSAHPCFFGIDFPTKEELIAGNKSVDEIKEFIQADSLGYLSVDGLLAPFATKDFCTACFTGEYPISIEGAHQKNELEKNSLIHHHE
ncbi:MAG TPA: amidophosphoribosyltransferase, partial [Victivallales bacterium]|nr:amidophosphoribosyltransferase [Victivallales bacterium]